MRFTKHIPSQSRIRILRRPSGVMLVEMVVALILLSAVASILPVVFRGVAEQRHLEHFDRLALVELGNAVERLRAGSASNNPPSVELSGWFRQRYPTATLEMQRMMSHGVETGDQHSWRVAVRRPTGANQPDQVQSVVTWVSSREVDE